MLKILHNFQLPFLHYCFSCQSPPQLKSFVQEEFMKTLEKAGPQLTSRLKGDWIGLYRYSMCICLFSILEHEVEINPVEYTQKRFRA